MPVPVIQANNPHVAELRQLARALCAQNSIGPSAWSPRHFVAPGAIFDSREGFSRRDRHWLRHAFRVCAAIGAPPADNFTITPLYYPQSNKQDFLDPGLRLPVAPDVAVACFVIDKSKHKAFMEKMIRKEKGKQGKLSLQRNFDRMYAMNGYLTNPYHSATAWEEAAVRHNIPLIVTFSIGHEIDASNFLGENYKPCLQGEIEMDDCLGRGGYYAETYKMESVVRTDCAGNFIMKNRISAQHL